MALADYSGLANGFGSIGGGLLGGVNFYPGQTVTTPQYATIYYQPEPQKQKSRGVLEDLRSEIKDWCGSVLTA